MTNGAAAPAVATGTSGDAARGHRGNWRTRAACRSAEPELFFPDGEAERAKAVCAACPVRRECLQFALATRQPYGIWGGMAEHERRVAQVRRPAR